MRINSLLIAPILVSIIVASLASAECVPEYVCPEWSACVEGIQTRTCNEVLCGQENIVERQLCGQGDVSCTVKYSCSEWGSCSYFEKTQDILNNNIRFEGYQERACIDLNNCVNDFVDRKSCEDSYKVKFVEVQQCGNSFLMALDEGSQRQVSQISIDSWINQRLDISFIQGNFSYCPSCYNGYQDNDEEGIDCGGSCKSCQSETGPSQQLLIIGSSWVVSALMFIGLITSSLFNRVARIRMLIYQAYKAVDRRDKTTAKYYVGRIKAIYIRMSEHQKSLVSKELNSLYRRI